MRKIIKTTKLTINHQTIRHLDGRELTAAVGGHQTFAAGCSSTCGVCPKIP